MPATLARRIQACALLAMLLASPSLCRAQWLPGGIPVPGGGGNYVPCPDGAGGVYILWKDARNFSVTDDDIYATRITPNGTVAPGFPADGLPVCTALDYQAPCGIALDTNGGAFLYWLDFRSTLLFFGSRITPAGEIAAGWPSDGRDMTTPLKDQYCGPPIADAEGGAYFLWDDYRTGNSDVYVERMRGDGTPAPGWPIDGVPAASGLADQLAPLAATDGRGGVIIVYRDNRTDAPGIYAQRITPTGAVAPGWPAGGVWVSSILAMNSVVPDGAGGVYIGLATPHPQYPGLFSVLSMARITGSGQIAPGWSFGGNVVCDTVAFRFPLDLASDSQGNVFAHWYDYRYDYAVMFAVRMELDGMFAPGWPKNGRRVSTLNMNQIPGGIIADGQGGMYSAFEARNYYYNWAAIQHLGPDGSPAPGWTSDGALLNPQDEQFEPRLAPDGSGGAYVVWDNEAVLPYGAVYIQHYLMDGVVATEISLVSTDVRPDRVSLLWQSASAQGLSATVYRRTETTAWQTLGTPTLDGPDRLRYEDRSVVAGTRYAYRLGYFDGGAEQFTSEAWVDVPALKLALEGARPNPAVRLMNVAFSLPNDSPAKLTVLDVAGRAVMSREVSSLGPGHHVVPLDLGVTAPPGLYWLRLMQGGRALLARAALIR